MTLILSSIAQVVLAEQLCVRREMREGFIGADLGGGSGGRNDIEMATGGVSSVLTSMRMEGKNTAGSNNGLGTSGSGMPYERVSSSER